MEYPKLQVVHTVEVKQTWQKGGQLFGEQVKVIEFSNDPSGHEIHADKLVGKHI